MSAAHNAAWKALHSVTLDSLASRHTVVSLLDNQTVEDAVKTLSENRILSAPVKNHKTGEVIGLLDMLDLVSFVLKVAPTPADMKTDPAALDTAARALALEQVGNVVNASGRDPLVPVFDHDPATHALDLFAKRVHRVVVYNAQNEFTGIVSQSTIVHFMADKLHVGELKNLGEKTLQELGLGGEVPTTVKTTDSVLRTIHLLEHNAVSAAALVEKDGKLAGNFSASVLRGLYADKWPSFLERVDEFLQRHSPDSLVPLCVYRSATFQTAVQELTKNKVHQIYVIDNDYKPVGILTLTDVIRVFKDASF
jgi:5'-AMP-activated protein kinase regulatory gamma subunit